MIRIRRIKLDEVAVARRLIYSVAHRVFRDRRSLEESMVFYELRGELNDMDDIQRTYFNRVGTFLIAANEEKMIGTGAIRKIDSDICELKRLWVLTEFQGKGVGYRMARRLLSFAKARGYQQIRLETDPVYQRQALDFYLRLGFSEIPRYSDHMDDIAMELRL